MKKKYKAFSFYYNALKKSEFYNNNKYIFINGCFDIFHLGHLKMINYAKELFPNHKLIIATNSDKSIMGMKKQHPLIFDEKYRSDFLAELADIVILYDEFYDYIEIIKDFKPDFIIKGPEYKDIDIPEKNLGINVIYYFGEDGISSTDIYNTIIKKYKDVSEI